MGLLTQSKPAAGGKKPGTVDLGALFGGKKPKKGEAKPAADTTNELNIISRRLKLLEEHFTILRRRVDVSEHNTLTKNKHFTSEFKTINSEISELRQMLNKVEDKVLLIIKELQLCARTDDLKTLKKYVEIWEPIRFVTRNEVEKIIDEKIDESKAV